MTIKKVDMYRDAGTGRLVTKQYAESHKRTTEHEVRKVSVPPSKPPSGGKKGK
jgi:hypothetical protein